MASSSEFLLYNYFRSSASYRVRIALEMKGIPFDYRPVHLVNGGGEQYKPEYQAINPSREVPTLVHKGRVIGQSLAIIDYLDSVQPTPRLFPVDPYKRALVLQACEIINSGAQPPGNLRVQKLLAEQFHADETQKDLWTKYWIRYGLETMEAFLKPHAGKFCFSDEVTAADCVLMPHMFNADRYKVATDGYPTINRISQNCERLEAFKKAAPSAQPDFPKA
jgi:maleylacetoacetate isomerase